MEPVVNKLQEGVKYPRFERDATKTINDLVDHITKERGVYSSSIEPNPSEHKVWFNTNNNTLYIYDGNTWTTINDKNVYLLKEREIYPYPAINIYDKSESIDSLNIEKNKHYIIIINTNNLNSFFNLITTYNNDKKFTILGNDNDTSGIFLVNIYDTYIYYIKLSSFYIGEDNVFYCDGGTLYFNADYSDNGNYGIYISGFYDNAAIKHVIENFEHRPIEQLGLNSIYIEPESHSIIIIGKHNFTNNFGILGEDLEEPNIYMYNNILNIGNQSDGGIISEGINWYGPTIHCNCKQIGDITITNENSDLNLYISSLNLTIGNNNTVIVKDTVCQAIDEDFYIHIIQETNDDKSKVFLGGNLSEYGVIDEYINLCGTPLNGKLGISIPCRTFITTTIDDIDRHSIESNPVDMSRCDTLIIDAPYKTFKNTEYINYLKTCNNLKIYVTDDNLLNYLNNQGLVSIKAVIHKNYYTDKILIKCVKYAGGNIIYETKIYKR